MPDVAVAEAAEAEDVVTGAEAGQDTTVTDEPENVLFSLDGEEEKKEERPAKAATVTTEEKPNAVEDLYKQSQSEVKELRAEIKKMNKAFYELRKERKAEKESKPAETEFTDAQILRIIEEHKDDPAVMLQVMKHVNKQASKDDRRAVMDEMESKTLRESGAAWLTERAPEVLEEGSDAHNTVMNAKAKLKLEDHPLGDTLAAAFLQANSLPQIVKDAVEAEKQKWLAESGEKGRKAAIKAGSPAATKGKESTGAAKDEAGFRSVGASMGLKGSALDLYVQMRKSANKNNKMVMEA